MAETVHRCPPDGQVLMPCCNRSPFAVLNEHMSLDPTLVTCEGAPAQVWVLLKERVPRHATTDTGAATVVGVYVDRDDLLARVERIAKANQQYPIRQVGEDGWFIGPEEDEGFFGHSPVELRAVSCPFHAVTA